MTRWRRIGMPRDRDANGRARNSRPRDALGRPLPYGSDNVERQPEGIVRTPAETITQAQELLDSGMPFHAHEVFEDAWKSSSGPDRELWKGLAQLAVGLTHLGRGKHARGTDVAAARFSCVSRRSPIGRPTAWTLPASSAGRPS